MLAVLAVLVLPACARAAEPPPAQTSPVTVYAGTTKRCALWRIDPATREFAPLVDIPGQGDTCYPSVIPTGADRYLVYNYTSPLDGPDEPWGTALLHGPTLIYRTTLTFG